MPSRRSITTRLFTILLFSCLIACSNVTATPAGSSPPASTSAAQPTRSEATAPPAPTASRVAPTNPPTATTLPSPTRAPSQTQAPPTSTGVPPTAPQAVASNTQAPAPTGSPIAGSTPAGSTSGTPGSYTLDVEPIVSGLVRPTYITDAGDNSGRLYVVEQRGRILVIENGKLRNTPFLDIRDLVNTSGNERGLLSVAFHPSFNKNGQFYVYYTGQPNGDTVVARYLLSRDPNVADPASAKTLLTVDQPEPNHNGGLLLFGPDGYLYIGLGDGGGGGDRHGSIGNGQNLNTLLGKILRIDVNQEPYAAPADNPFAGRSDARPEIWAYGLRNPWRFSFDRETHDLYIADVGQGAYEEVNFQPASSHGGENYGWRLMEGAHCYNPAQGCPRDGLVLPIAEYTHDSGCSITGGYVYRGARYPWLRGQYLFADYCTGIVWSTQPDASGKWNTVQRGRFDFTVSSFGEDQQGELYVLAHNEGAVYRLTSAE